MMCSSEYDPGSRRVGICSLMQPRISTPTKDRMRCDCFPSLPRLPAALGLPLPVICTYASESALCLQQSRRCTALYLSRHHVRPFLRTHTRDQSGPIAQQRCQSSSHKPCQTLNQRLRSHESHVAVRPQDRPAWSPVRRLPQIPG